MSNTNNPHLLNLVYKPLSANLPTASVWKKKKGLRASKQTALLSTEEIQKSNNQFAGSYNFKRFWWFFFFLKHSGAFEFKSSTPVEHNAQLNTIQLAKVIDTLSIFSHRTSFHSKAGTYRRKGTTPPLKPEVNRPKGSNPERRHIADAPQRCSEVRGKSQRRPTRDSSSDTQRRPGQAGALQGPAPRREPRCSRGDRAGRWETPPRKPAVRKHCFVVKK